jgi:hypothetical protein
MGMNELLKVWERARAERRTVRGYQIELPVREAARVEALGEMYGRSPGEIIADLLREALDELERALPYVQGDRVIAEDEFGDPIYEDAGPTPRLLALARKHQDVLGTETGGGDTA